jgi:hypothetical protein
MVVAVSRRKQLRAAPAAQPIHKQLMRLAHPCRRLRGERRVGKPSRILLEEPRRGSREILLWALGAPRQRRLGLAVSLRRHLDAVECRVHLHARPPHHCEPDLGDGAALGQCLRREIHVRVQMIDGKHLAPSPDGVVDEFPCLQRFHVGS